MTTLVAPKQNIPHLISTSDKSWNRLGGLSGTPAVLHATLTDFGGRNLPGLPIIPIVRPTRYNYMMGNRIVQILSISMLCNDCRADTL
jgi:hypothetical protein